MSGDRLALAFGKVLREQREAQELSQEEVAHRAQTNQAYVSLLEAGRRCPSLATAHLIAAALGMTLTQLVQMVEKASSRPSR